MPLIQVLAFRIWVQIYKKRKNKLHAINFQKKNNSKIKHFIFHLIWRHVNSFELILSPVLLISILLTNTWLQACYWEVGRMVDETYHTGCTWEIQADSQVFQRFHLWRQINRIFIQENYDLKAIHPLFTNIFLTPHYQPIFKH